MIDPPAITQSKAQQTAVIRVTVPRSRIQEVMGPAIGEVIAAVTAQGIGPAGPVCAYHLKTDAANFDFEVGVPVTGPVTPVGRVKPGQLPATRVARTVYHGRYEDLHAAWGEFMRWIASNGYSPGPTLWESYVVGPESSADPGNWRTELNRPLL